MTLRVKMALIDLDGTLVDSVPDLAVSVDDMMRQMGLPERGEDKVRRWVGNGVERLVKRALLDNLDGEPDDALYDKALPLFLDAYKQHNGNHSCLFPGVTEGIAYLKSIGLHLGCVTNKPKAFTEPLLQQLGVFDEFALVVSGDSLPKKKPDPMPLTHAASFFQVAPQASLMIGDSVNDVEAARSAGFQVACVTYGYNHGQDIRLAEPDLVMDSLAELSGAVERLD